MDGLTEDAHVADDVVSDKVQPRRLVCDRHKTIRNFIPVVADEHIPQTDHAHQQIVLLISTCNQSNFR